VLSAWLLCWTCWHIPRVLFRKSKWVWSPLCKLAVCFLKTGWIFSLLVSWFLLLLNQFVSVSWQCVLYSSVCDRSAVLSTSRILPVVGLFDWYVLRGSWLSWGWMLYAMAWFLLFLFSIFVANSVWWGGDPGDFVRLKTNI
jgi:hypothetical protein